MENKQFENELLPEELREVKTRREILGIEEETTEDPYDSNLVGLALSGGGIRSSTLGLGVLQSLSRHNLLPRVDYLSTVSGGGFIGGCLSSTLNDPEARSDAENFPLLENAGSAESNELTQLRHSGKYLAPEGFLEKLRIPALLVRGMLINLVLILPVIVLAVFFTEFWAEFLGFGDEILVHVMRLSTVLFIVLALVPPYLSFLFVNRFNWKSRQRYEYVFIFFLVIALAALSLYPLTLLIEYSIDISWGRLIYTTIDGFSWATHSPQFWLIVLATVSVLAMAGRASRNLASLRNRLMLYLAALIGPGLIFTTYALLCVWQVDSPYIHLSAGYNLPKFDAHELSKGYLPEVLMARMREEDQPLDMKPGDKLTETIEEGKSWRVSDGTHEYAIRLQGRNVQVENQWLVKALDKPTLPDSVKSLLADRGMEIEGEVKVETSERGGWRFDVADQEYTITRPQDARIRISPQPRDLLDKWDKLFYSGAILLFILNFIFVNVNFTSLHGFYRDQLTRGFLFRKGTKSGRDSGRRVKMSELNTAGSAAPYHLVNVTMNLQGSDDIKLRGRGADFFLLSRHFIGSDRTGYVLTESMEEADPHMDLGTAMAISGAAASPNAGSVAIRPLVFIMTMLNLRLGYWAPNPYKLKDKSAIGRFLMVRGAGPTYVFREAMGYLDARHTFVNLSDGGHLENMGIYQLLRRQCRVIICSDGECDPLMQCGGLVKVIRLAAIDLGIRIDIDIDALRKDKETQYSAAHYVVGDIDYGNGKKGKLYYIKASLTGDENLYIREYHQRFPEFPNESSAEQFFSEEQFEAYRALGSHMADEMFRENAELEKLRWRGSPDRQERG
jgi:hypothetical protein